MLGLLKGMRATVGHLFTKKVTVQYPEQRPQLPERSRGLLRLRLQPDTMEPRCISCTFCEQICPSVAIRVIYEDKQPEKVWSLDAGSGPMLSTFQRGEKPLGLEMWPEKADPLPAPDRDGCLASSLLDANGLSAMVLAKTASRNGVWLAQVFGVATFYDQLRPGAEVPAADESEQPHTPVAVVPGTPSILLSRHGSIDPESIDAYADSGGYKAATDALTGMSPSEVLDEIAVSGLRGRGGAGYSTGSKWQLASDTEAPQKYIICNAAEGDLGSVKDRSLLEHDPHAVVEGMIIAGYAVGATNGIIYASIRNRLALERVQIAVMQAEEKGFLGDELPGTDFSFSIKVRAVPDAFAAGEETTLITTLEGGRPMPRVRPPYPAETGLHGMPTVIENVETLATVPWIIANGSREFQQIGASQAPGTRLFMMSGAVASPGLYEATLDITLKKLAEAAGGFTGEVKAALVGSSGGGFLSPGLFDIPLDYESISETGGDMSSGVIRVLGGEDCVVDIMRECLAFSASQSCGKCVPCRLGTWRLLDLIDRVCSGEGSEDDLSLAADLASDIADGALCGLGRGAVRPLQTGMKFFQKEFTDHARGETSCKSGRCAAR
ncbi:MAG: NADH-ubiquinone oxidoreductase-F iron-sulfur binding region domain-containing protein [Thermoleophilia bacterium]|nr:NADH-ubiquinone oxidoreductase-F iron-sulfur binding region domain-containing protein [Thermoleophilia bacterium]